MSPSTVVLITGVNKGIGKGLLEKYLARPNHTIIGSVRETKASASQDLDKIPKAEGSRLLLVGIDSISSTDTLQAFKDVEAAGIEHVDLIIANAGMGPMPPKKLDAAEIETVEYALQVNTLGPIRLFQAFKPLLEKSSSPKWVSVSSGAGSITNCEKYMAFYAGAYGVSKAAQDWFTIAIHAGNPSLVAFAIHPGHVQTDMGNIGARIVGLKEAPHTIEESTSKTMDLIDKATREGTSGKFINVINGQEIPW
ncbi:hypothetical protein BDP55DRAFT_732576 [Colletotrichum godetiae]|uniref:Aflatoxin biosynthesis ketoreductase nor-1 n=1 Tax=Colletotrichum godetiae TaxID=1209918 RepID=A0AAJ0EQ28_9PEZI|nr:uncharacterized protein BDP55DRAFT_732576 [Colletotrichum godetiae]KAK1671152.1 hypothetical protein BDP55DRAFT_732576 [Colletotrichum godetiae]